MNLFLLRSTYATLLPCTLLWWAVAPRHPHTLMLTLMTLSSVLNHAHTSVAYRVADRAIVGFAVSHCLVEARQCSVFWPMVVNTAVSLELYFAAKQTGNHWWHAAMHCVGCVNNLLLLGCVIGNSRSLSRSIP
jgi:hypothetical protein